MTDEPRWIEMNLIDYNGEESMNTGAVSTTEAKSLLWLCFDIIQFNVVTDFQHYGGQCKPAFMTDRVDAKLPSSRLCARFEELLENANVSAVSDH